MDACIKESMRMHNTTGGAFRCVTFHMTSFVL
jgi:hypothetical protein